MCQSVFKDVVSRKIPCMCGQSTLWPRCSTIAKSTGLVTFPVRIHFFSNCKAQITPLQMAEAKGDVWVHVTEKPMGRSTWIGRQVRGRVWLECQTRSPGFFSPPVTWSCLLHTSFLSVSWNGHNSLDPMFSYYTCSGKEETSFSQKSLQKSYGNLLGHMPIPQSIMVTQGECSMPIGLGLYPWSQPHPNQVNRNGRKGMSQNGCPQERKNSCSGSKGNKYPLQLFD